MKSDIEHIEEMDLKWLMASGWTVAGNLAYRRILEVYNRDRDLSLELLEQIFMQYDCFDQLPKIQAELQVVMQLCNDVSDLTHGDDRPTGG